jgi:hypothetical protein
MRYRLSVLNVISGLYLLGCLLFTAFNYSTLSANEGWGVIGMIALVSFGVVILIVDFALQQFIRDKATLNTIGAFVALTAAAYLLFY